MKSSIKLIGEAGFEAPVELAVETGFVDSPFSARWSTYIFLTIEGNEYRVSDPADLVILGRMIEAWLEQERAERAP